MYHTCFRQGVVCYSISYNMYSFHCTSQYSTVITTNSVTPVLLINGSPSSYQVKKRFRMLNFSGLSFSGIN